MAAAKQRIGEYVLDQPLGAGAFGQVWRAVHHVWADRVVAVKIPTDPQYIRNLQRESAAVHGLHHPNIVRAIGFDPFADPPYLVTEYVPGRSLRALLDERGGRLPAGEAAGILRQVLAGLAHAHAAGMVHLDIKPENILIHERAAREGFDADGVVKVTDFGLGRAAKAATGSILYSASLAGEDAKVVGTLDYMAPEQRGGAAAALDARADLYACGVVLYEMLTGERPAGLAVPSDLNADIPPHLDEAFRRAYARHDRRFASAEEFAAALVGPADGPPGRAPIHAVQRSLLSAAFDRLAELHGARAALRPAKGKTTTSTGLLIAAGCAIVAALICLVAVASSGGHAARDGAGPFGVLLVVAAGLGVASTFVRRHEARQVADADGRLIEHARRMAAGFPGAFDAWGGEAVLRNQKGAQALADVFKQGGAAVPFPKAGTVADPSYATQPPAAGADDVPAAAPPRTPALVPPHAVRQAAQALLPSLLEQLGEAKAAAAEARKARTNVVTGFGVAIGILALATVVCGLLALIDLVEGFGPTRGGAASTLLPLAGVAILLLAIVTAFAWVGVGYHRRMVANLERRVGERAELVAAAFPGGAEPPREI